MPWQSLIPWKRRNSTALAHGALYSVVHESTQLLPHLHISSVAVTHKGG